MEMFRVLSLENAIYSILLFAASATVPKRRLILSMPDWSL